ncbi:hypothetical protein F5Y03DRAFT_397371 [Xylaria venustula]|nr:hypothetical protein F5Y03DRAFT_397371 [Xylaria venustula]
MAGLKRAGKGHPPTNVRQALSRPMIKSSEDEKNVRIFESGAAFKEAPMTIGIACNAQPALELIGPSTTQCLERAAAVLMRGVRFMLAHSEAAGRVADEVDDVCDILVGADGIYGVLQQLIMAEDDPATSPQNSGAWFLMTLQPFEMAQSSLGKELVNIEDSREDAWADKNAFLVHYIPRDGKLVQFIIVALDDEVHV